MVLRRAESIASSLAVLGQQLPARRSIDAAVVRFVHEMTRPSGEGAGHGPDASPSPAPEPTVPPPVNHDAAPQLTQTADGQLKETKMDRDLRDDMLKLIRYKVLFVKREDEHAFPEQEDLVS